MPHERSPAPPEPARTASRTGRLVRLALTVAILGWVLHHYGIRLSAETFTGVTAPGWILAGPVAVLFVNPWASAWRWRIVLGMVGIRERIVPLVRIAFLGSFFGLALPTTLGPDAIRVLLIERRHPAHRGRATATVVADRALGFVSLSLLGLAGAVGARAHTGTNGVTTMAAISGMVILALAAMTHARTERVVEKALDGLRAPARLKQFVHSTATTLGQIPLWRAFPRLLPLILIYQLSTVTVTWALFQSFGWDVPYSLHVAFVPISMIISTLPVSVGGFGLREGAFVHLYGLVGVPADVAFSVSVLLFVVTVGFAGVIGALWAVVDHVRPADLREAEAPRETVR